MQAKPVIVTLAAAVILASGLALALAAGTGPAQSRRNKQATTPAAAPAPGTQPGTVTGKVVVSFHGEEVRDRSGVVITLDDVPGDPVAPVHARIRQRGSAFVPALVVVTRGSTVDFPNDDKIFHNVFSLSRAARFDLGLYKSGTSKSVTLRRAGAVDVHCNIHADMTATIKVVDTSFHAVTGRDGTFRLDKVPPGTYPIVAWQPHGDEVRGTVTVEPGGTSAITLVVEQARAPRRHLRKDGTPYGRYR